MIKKRRFLAELYRYRVPGGSTEIPFIEYFQKDKSLRNALYCSYINHIRRDAVIEHLSQIETIKILKNVSDTINDFDELVLTKSEYSPTEYAEVFAKDITTKLEKIGLTKLSKAILTDFVEKMESMEIEASRVVWSNEIEFAVKFGVSVDEAKSNYRELKRYADNYLNYYLATLDESSKNVESDINVLIQCVQPIYEHYIEFKIDGGLNPNYWYDLNHEFAKSVLSDGLTMEFLLPYKDFLNEFSNDIESFGQEIHKIFIAVWKFAKENNPSKKKSERTRFDIAYSDFEMKSKELSETLVFLKKISIDNETDADKARKFCDYHLQRFNKLFSKLGIDLTSNEKIKNAVSFDEVNFLAGQSSEKGKSNPEINANSDVKRPKRGEAKYYALYHWVLIEMGKERDFERNRNDQYKASKIKEFAESRYKFQDGQSFYRAFIGTDITNKVALAKDLGNGYKEKVISLSNNDAGVISHLKDFPN